MSKIVKLETLVGLPPTSKCQETISVLEEVVRRHPDEARLAVYHRGELDNPENSSVVMSVLLQKGCAIPAVVVNGALFSKLRVPTLEEVDTEVQRVLSL
jgi:hypothetical protein